MLCWNCGSPKHTWQQCPKQLTPAVMAMKGGKGKGKDDKGGKGKKGKEKGKDKTQAEWDTAAEPAEEGKRKRPKVGKAKKSSW